MPVRSLVEICSRICIKNIKELDSIADLPYEKLRHILLRVEHAEQLRRIEVNSPQIEGQTGELWLKLIEKDFPLEFKAKAYKPSDPSRWYKVYKKYKKEHDEKKEASDRQLRAAMAGLKEDRAKNTSLIVNRKQLPRNGATGAKKSGWGRGSSSSAMNMNFTAGSRTKTSTGRGVMKKVRREAKDIANVHGSLSRVIGAPKLQTQLTRAPPGMVNEYRRAAQPSSIPTERRPRVSEAVKAHEERATFISDDDDDDDNDLFDELEGRTPRKVKPFSKPAPEPSKKLLSSSASASLLKSRPKTAPVSRPVQKREPPRVEETKERPSASRPIQKRRSPRPEEAKERPDASAKSPIKKTTHQSPSRPSTSSSQANKMKQSGQAAVPKEPTPSQPSTALSPLPAKRKAPSIFMKPNKRAR